MHYIYFQILIFFDLDKILTFYDLEIKYLIQIIKDRFLQPQNITNSFTKYFLLLLYAKVFQSSHRLNRLKYSWNLFLSDKMTEL